MISPDLISRLARIVGPENVSVASTTRAVYSYDASLAEGRPEAAVFPENADQLARVVRAAARAGVPFIPRGYGTNLSGGTVAPFGGLIVEFSRMNRILSIDPAARRAVVQPGVPNLELQNALAKFGFFYAPDPASQKVATLGGNAAENSGGPRCLKYGVTTNHLLGLEVILADGTLVELGGPDGDSAGPDLRGLLIGSEGTFGLIASLTVRILPLPEAAITLLVIYDSLEAAAESVADVIAAGIVPAALEMMDRPVMHAVEDSLPCGYPRDAEAVLIVEVEGPPAGLASQAGRIRQICRDRGCREVREARDAGERNRLWAGRRGAFGAVARLAPRYLVADCTVPRSRLPEALRRVREIAERYGLAVGNVFHAGDGNLHPLLLFDPRLPGRKDDVHAAGWEVMEACVRLGGTITGEHGVGLEKKEALRLVFSEDDLALMKRIKGAFDPDDRLNPGKVLPDDIRPPDPPAPRDFDPGPSRVLTPRDEAEAAAIARWAVREKIALRPSGSGFAGDYGNRPALEPLRLSSLGLDRILAVDPANQTVTAQAGVTLGRLQEALAGNGQWLPLRLPGGGGRTLGGIAALGACGPERLAHGAPRDLLLGLGFVSGEGRIISAGGQVVKNVAGYDLTRLLVGSAGTLGFLTRLIFRTFQRPEACLMVSAPGKLEACAAAASALLVSTAEPTFITAFPEPNAGGGPTWRFLAGLEGLADSTAARRARVGAILDGAGLCAAETLEYSCWPGPWDEILGPVYAQEFVVRLDLPLNRVRDGFAILEKAVGNALFFLDFGRGLVLAGVDDLDPRAWAGLPDRAAELGGRTVLVRAPGEFKQGREVFGPARSDRDLTTRIKNALDPAGIFSPGALPGGL
ncbi:MAG: FAD-linked oxidase C-terminal domain-containing protein [Pseudomonadota bacterium]